MRFPAFHVQLFYNNHLNVLIMGYQFHKTILSLIHKYLRYSQKCNISSKLHGQLNCSTGIEGNHSAFHFQKNQAYPSNLETSPQFLVKSLTSLILISASKSLLKILASFFLTKSLNFPPFFCWAHEVNSRKNRAGVSDLK